MRCVSMRGVYECASVCVSTCASSGPDGTFAADLGAVLDSAVLQQEAVGDVRLLDGVGQRRELQRPLTVVAEVGVVHVRNAANQLRARERLRVHPPRLHFRLVILTNCNSNISHTD